MKKYLTIILVLFIGGLFFFLDELFTEPISDELLYKFKLGDHALGDEDYSEYILSFKDVLVSQFHQYFYSNGRFFVHVLVQTFDALAPRWVFDLFNLVVLISVMVLLMRYTYRNEANLSNPLLWVLTVLAYFYGFPGNVRLFISIPGAFNYLWPMLLVLGFLIMWRHIERNTYLWGATLCFVLFAFIVGWCQECFSIPLSGAIFIYLIMNMRRVKPSMMIVALALFMGTAILTFAPGNFVRLSSSGRTSMSGYIMSAFQAIKLLIGMKLFWLMLIAFVVAKINGLKLKTFVRENSIEMLCLLFAILLGFAANTLPQSFTGIEFFSLIIIYRLIDSSNFNLNQKYCRWIALTVMLLFAIHQSVVAKYRHDMVAFHQNIIKEYVNSADGIILCPKANIPALVRTYVTDWTTSKVRWWDDYTITAFYGSKDKPLRMLPQLEYDLLKDPDGFDTYSSLKVAGTLECVPTESGYYCRLQPTDTVASSQIVMYPYTLEDNPTWFTRLKYRLGNNHQPDTIVKSISEYEILTEDSVAVTIRLPKPLNRRVKEINIIK